MRRVVVTGMGVISALGQDCSAFWQALREGRPGIGPIEAVDRTKLRFENGAEVRAFNPALHFEAAPLAMFDRFTQLAMVAARQAAGEARLGDLSHLQERMAVVTGTSIGGQTTNQEVVVDLYAKQRNTMHPFTIPRVMPNAAASHIATELGITGPAFTVSTACSSSSHALGLAFQMVRSGMAELAVSGGSEAPFSLGFLKAWEALRVVAPDTCRPFSKSRKGLILGEGGAILVLESLESARTRGVPIHAEVVGVGMTADADHITRPSASGAARAMKAALEDGGLSPEQVDYINVHGTGTPTNDVTETRAIHSTFGPHARRLAVSSTKSMHGHVLGGTGAIEAVATVLTLENQVIPPTANFTEPDPECDLDVVPNVARPAQVECALSNSFAFGGLNAVLAFRRWETP
jgi:nodulation protein E